MALLTDELLAFSRVLKSDMAISEIDMEKLVKDVWDGIRETNAERELGLRIGNMQPGFSAGRAKLDSDISEKAAP